METEKRSTRARRGETWRWPDEAEPPQDTAASGPAPRGVRAGGFPDGVVDNDKLRREVVERPDDDDPRREYAAWMLAQEHEFARTIGTFITAQLTVADAFRENPRADVIALRSWSGMRGFVSTVDFRAGDTLRPWFLDALDPLIAQGIVGWPQVYRGFVERVAMRADRFLELADELFHLAPIRHLVLIRVPEVIDQLAASPHLARIRSLSLPRHGRTDALTDAMLARLLASPYLGNLVQLRLIHQQLLSLRACEAVVTAATLPMLSNFELYIPLRAGEHEPDIFDPTGRAERMIAYDTPLRSIRPKDWIAELERALGHIPCVHPGQHYGRDFCDIEAVTAHPIALDPQVMARRGLPVGGLPAARRARP